MVRAFDRVVIIKCDYSIINIIRSHNIGPECIYVEIQDAHLLSLETRETGEDEARVC